MGFDASFFLSHQVSYKSWEFFGTANAFLARMLTIFWHLEPLSLALCKCMCVLLRWAKHIIRVRKYIKEKCSLGCEVCLREGEKKSVTYTHIALMHLYTAAHREVCSCVVRVYLCTRRECCKRRKKWQMMFSCKASHERSMAWKARAPREENREKRYERAVRAERRKKQKNQLKIWGLVDPFTSQLPQELREREMIKTHAALARALLAENSSWHITRKMYFPCLWIDDAEKMFFSGLARSISLSCDRSSFLIFPLF